MKSKIEAEDGPQAEDRKEEEHHWSRRAINEWWHDLVEEKLITKQSKMLLNKMQVKVKSN